jgi:hypothetical protein
MIQPRRVYGKVPLCWQIRIYSAINFGDLMSAVVRRHVSFELVWRAFASRVRLEKRALRDAHRTVAVAAFVQPKVSDALC